MIPHDETSPFFPFFPRFIDTPIFLPPSIEKYIYINRVKWLIQRAGRYHFLFSTKKKRRKNRVKMTEKEEEKKIARVWRIVASDRFRRSNARIKRGAKSLIDSARSWLPRYEKSLSHPSSSRVKFCSVNHNVTSIHPRDRDWQSAYTRVHARLMNLPCPTLHVSGRNASVRARARGARGPLLLLASARCPGWDTLWEITLYIWCYLFSWKQLWKFGKRDFFGKFFLFSGRKKRELKVFEVSKFFCLDF